MSRSDIKFEKVSLPDFKDSNDLLKNANDLLSKGFSDLAKQASNFQDTAQARVDLNIKNALNHMTLEELQNPQTKANIHNALVGIEAATGLAPSLDVLNYIEARPRTLQILRENERTHELNEQKHKTDLLAQAEALSRGIKAAATEHANPVLIGVGADLAGLSSTDPDYRAKKQETLQLAKVNLTNLLQDKLRINPQDIKFTGSDLEQMGKDAVLDYLTQVAQTAQDNPVLSQGIAHLLPDDTKASLGTLDISDTDLSHTITRILQPSGYEYTTQPLNPALHALLHVVGSNPAITAKERAEAEAAQQKIENDIKRGEVEIKQQNANTNTQEANFKQTKHASDVIIDAQNRGEQEGKEQTKALADQKKKNLEYYGYNPAGVNPDGSYNYQILGKDIHDKAQKAQQAKLEVKDLAGKTHNTALAWANADKKNYTPIVIDGWFTWEKQKDLVQVLNEFTDAKDPPRVRQFVTQGIMAQGKFKSDEEVRKAASIYKEQALDYKKELEDEMLKQIYEDMYKFEGADAKQLASYAFNKPWASAETYLKARLGKGYEIR